MNKFLVFTLVSLLLASCGDVASALFAGREDEYDFTNEALYEGLEVNEDLIHWISLSSDSYAAPDGTYPLIQAVYIGDLATIDQDTVILYLHGNGQSLNPFWSTIAHLANFKSQHHYGVMSYDYRGFGKSEGQSRNAETMASDLDAVLEWLEGQGVVSDRLMVVANSLGSLPAGPAAAGEARIPFKKLVMEVPQSSADAIIQDATGLALPASMVTSYEFDLGADMANYNGDLLWMHGTADEVAPFHNAQQAMYEYQGPLFVEAVYSEATHGLRWSIGPGEWEKVIQDFFER